MAKKAKAKKAKAKKAKAKKVKPQLGQIVSGKMTADQYRDALDNLELTQLRLGELFKVGQRTSRRWALNGGRIPFTAAALLKFLVDGKITLEDIQQIG